MGRRVTSVSVSGCGERRGRDSYSHPYCFGIATVKFRDGSEAKVNLDVVAKIVGIDTRFGVSFGCAASTVVTLNGQHVDLAQWIPAVPAAAAAPPGPRSSEA